MYDDDFFGFREEPTRDPYRPLVSVLDAMRTLDFSAESPIEDRFIRSLRPYLSKDARVLPQYELPGARLDFLIACRDRYVGIECDGAAFHEARRDLTRDTRILRRTRISSICRFPGSICNSSRIVDALWQLYLWEPEIFSEVGRVRLRAVAQPAQAWSPTRALLILDPAAHVSATVELTRMRRSDVVEFAAAGGA